MKSGAVGFALLVVCAALVASGITVPLDIKQGNYGTPGLSVLVAATISFALVLLAEAIFTHLPSSVSRSATRLAYAAFTVVLLHPLVLWLMLKFAPTVPNWLVFVVTITVPWLIGIAVLRAPGSLWLTGVARLKRRPEGASPRAEPM